MYLYSCMFQILKITPNISIDLIEYSIFSLKIQTKFLREINVMKFYWKIWSDCIELKVIVCV